MKQGNSSPRVCGGEPQLVKYHGLNLEVVPACAGVNQFHDEDHTAVVPVCVGVSNRCNAYLP